MKQEIINGFTTAFQRALLRDIKRIADRHTNLEEFKSEVRNYLDKLLK